MCGLQLSNLLCALDRQAYLLQMSSIAPEVVHLIATVADYTDPTTLALIRLPACMPPSCLAVITQKVSKLHGPTHRLL